MFEAAERAYQVEKGYNALLGITREDDIRRGTTRGEEDPIHAPGMLEEYYHYRGCSVDGVPTRKRLKEIGLGDLIGDLEKRLPLEEGNSPAINQLVV